jgi:hypothetical protein
MFKRLQIVSPAGAQSGGPESLHNLASLAKRLGFDVEMVYFPYREGHQVPDRYVHYQVPVSTLKDESDVAVIFPEVYCMQAFKLKNAKPLLWWLSVDFFERIKYHSFRDKVRYVLMALRGERPFFGVKALKGITHITKAAYDRMFLEKNGLSGLQLAGPISSFYLQGHADSTSSAKQRQNVILYSPRRDTKAAPALMAHFPEYKFVPLSGLSEDGLRNFYRSSKLYIDFGNHPGKERMPREAAACGCCVITGLLGSAANDVDVPIPRRFKLDVNDPSFFDKFKSVVSEVFENFPQVSAEFDSYRREIFEDPAQQENDFLKIAEALRLEKVRN